MKLNFKPLLAIVLTLAGLQGMAADAPPPKPPAAYNTEIKPVLAKYCVRCHGMEKKKGGIDFAAIADEKSAFTKRKVWLKAIDQIAVNEMPPEGEEQIAQPEKDRLVSWLKYAAEYVDCSPNAVKNPGPTPIRRLTRTEYDNSIRALTGMDIDSGKTLGMPDDAAVHGFDNLANNLVLPPIVTDKYFSAADILLERMFDPDSIKAAATKKEKPKDTQKRETDLKKQAVLAYQNIIFVKPSAELTDEAAARKILDTFAKKAYRRPLLPGESDRLFKLHKLGVSRGQSWETALKMPLKAVLVSPHFLLRAETGKTPANGPYSHITDHELATRLSYFLWSSMPDDELTRCADDGSLTKPEVLEAQVKRMLTDPQAASLTSSFARQWLQLQKLEAARPSTEFFPAFTYTVRQAMKKETEMFFDKLRAEDRSVLELLECDYAYVNQELSKLYGIEGVTSYELKKVSLKNENHRGGLLGMGSILSMTSHTSRTSPTLRGKWILEVIMGDPPPPPPPDVGQIKEQKKGQEPVSFREQLAQHANRASCAACHAKIDPMGFAMENYDAVGVWRDTAGGGKPLDNTGKLPSGVEFKGVGELKKIIWNSRDKFERNLAEQMLTYALGRELDYYDECVLRDISSRLNKGEHKFSALIMGIVTSFPFQNRAPNVPR